jgi:energy-converting hydrogenase A subunit A
MIIPFDIWSLIINYIIAIAAAFVVGLILRLPILPERPMRQSWTISVIFPTLVLAVGFTAMFSKLGYSGMVLAGAIGVLSAVFSKYLLEKILPRPTAEEAHE